MKEYNWSNNYAYQAARLHRPTSIDEVRRIVAGAAKVHALGARHSFNGVADATGELIDLSDIGSKFAIDRERLTVTVGAGTRRGELAAFLQAQGFALHSTASLPHISVAGATATGTHGSGDRNGNLATAVAGLEIVTASGDLVEIKRGGAFGIVTRVTLDIQPSFEMLQDAFAALEFRCHHGDGPQRQRDDDVVGARSGSPVVKNAPRRRHCGPGARV